MTDGNSDPQFGQEGSSGWDGTGTAPKAAAGTHWHSLPIPTASVTSYDPEISDLEAATVQEAIDALAAGGSEGATVTAAGSGTALITSASPGYVAFPLLCRAANGDLLLFYYRGTTHNTSLDGNLYMRRSTDEGATWGSESTVYNPTGLDTGASEALVLRNGTIILTGAEQDGDDLADTFTGWILKSTDDGATWGSPIYTDTQYINGGNHREVPVGIVELPDGRLLMALFARLAAGSADKLVSFISDDEGLTWGNEATIVSDSDSWSEARLALLDDGSVLALLRNDTDKDIYTSRTTDDGATWSTPALAFSGWGYPRFRRLNSGAIVIIYRQDDGTSNGRAVYRVSYDQCATWSDEQNLETSGLDMQYADLLPIPGSTTVRAAYSIENSSTDADIYVTTLTDIADVRYRSEPLLTVSEEDGSPVAHAVRELRFPADAVTVNGDGSVSIVTGSDVIYEPLTAGASPNFEPVYTADGHMIMVPG